MTFLSFCEMLLKHEASICLGLALVISELLPLVKGPYNGILQSIVALLKARAAAKAALRGVALAVLPLFFLASLPGCAFCKEAVHAEAPRCVLEGSMLKCGESAGFALVPLVLGLIAGVVSGVPFDAQALEKQLLSQGVKDVPCVLAALLDYISGSALAKAGDPASFVLAGQIREGLVAALAKRGAHGVVQLKLRAGHVVEVVVP